MLKFQLLIFILLTFGFHSWVWADDPLAVGTPAPNFILTDLEGNEYSLNELHDNIVVLEWTNPNCPFVVRLYVDDIIPSLQRKSSENGVVWLAINSTYPGHRDYETEKQLSDIYDIWNAAYSAQLMDIDGSVGKKYRAVTTPHIFIIDKNGIIVYNGAIDDDPRGNKEEPVNHTKNALAEILEGKGVSVAVTRPYGCTVKYSKDS